MKLSNKVRWILALASAPATFFGWVVLANLLPSASIGDFFAVMAFITSFLAGLIVAPLHGKRLFFCVATLFILSCLFPPWRASSGDRHPMGYALVFDPPQENGHYQGEHIYAQIEFERLFLEWAALAGITGVIWLIVVKPSWLRGNKADHPRQFIPPTGNPQN